MAQLKLRNPFDEATTPPVLGPPQEAAEEITGETPPQVRESQGPDPTVRLSVDLDRRLHRRLRRWALERDRTASDLIRELLNSALDAAGY